MSKLATTLLVVAAAIRDPAGRILLQQCPAHKRHAGLWEFPGGKVEPGETPRAALVREIAEELGLTIDPQDLSPAGFADEPAEGMRPSLLLALYACTVWSGEPEGREGQRWGWFDTEEAAALPMPPMDCRLLARLARDCAG